MSTVQINEENREETIFDRLGDRPEMAERIDWTLIEIDKASNSVHLSFTPIEDFTNALGRVHGGFVVAMLDECMGSAVVGVTDAEFFPITVSLTTNFTKPVLVGKVFAEGHITSIGKKYAFLEGTLRDSDGEILARAIGSYRLVPFLGAEEQAQ
jgi:uncharacterized protein (TIGR00369 family)